MTCELCAGDGGEVLWRDAQLRVVLVADCDYPGFCRVIWNGHVREMTDLSEADARYLLQVVLAVEAAVREAMAPDKVNLASLGNLTPHLHWHVIPRYADDRHFPRPVWAAPVREAAARPALALRLADLQHAVARRLGGAI